MALGAEFQTYPQKKIVSLVVICCYIKTTLYS